MDNIEQIMAQMPRLTEAQILDIDQEHWDLSDEESGEISRMVVEVHQKIVKAQCRLLAKEGWRPSFPNESEKDERIKLLLEALRTTYVKMGIIREDAEPTGPELLVCSELLPDGWRKVPSDGEIAKRVLVVLQLYEGAKAIAMAGAIGRVLHNEWLMGEQDAQH